MAYYLGVDVGTSGVKALLVDAEGSVVASAVEAHPSYTPRPLWSEQEPEDWWTATVASVRKAVGAAGAGGKQVAGIGLSGQMHGLVVLDRGGRVLRRAILWNDQRTSGECAEITATVGARRLIALACNPALTGFTAPKILWLRKNEPAIYEKARHFLLPKDYVRFRMTGEYATDVSDASGTLLLDVAKRRWSGELLTALKIDGSLLPKTYESVEITGRLSRKAADELGLKAGTPVVGGGGDQAAGGIGAGVVRAGIVSVSLGTSGVVFAHSDEVRTDPRGRLHTFCHAVPGKWHVMGVSLCSGGSLQWFRNALCGEERAVAERTGQDSYDLISLAASRAPAGCEGLMFLPYLTGERTPHADPFARGAFIGITPRTTRAHMARAVFEGVAFSLLDSLDIIRSLNVPAGEIRLVGGGARGAFWRQVLADVFNADIFSLRASEGPAFGAAILAATATGRFGSVEEACSATVKTSWKDGPNPERAGLYAKLHPIWKGLYRSLKEDFTALAGAIE
ncbi:MAG: xylulokinase [Planctomycetota bacterium]|nr:xylulokinase [Planctomycetota bacterium]